MVAVGTRERVETRLRRLLFSSALPAPRETLLALRKGERFETLSPREDGLRPRVDTRDGAVEAVEAAEGRCLRRFSAAWLRPRWAAAWRLLLLGAERDQEREERFHVGVADGRVLRTGAGAVCGRLRLRLRFSDEGARERPREAALVEGCRDGTRCLKELCDRDREDVLRLGRV